MNTLDALHSEALQGARQVKLACGLTEFPRALFDLADSLEVLDLSDNALSSLPDDFSRLHKLRILFCSNNQFTHVPEVLGQCAHLSMVGFKANQIQTVSEHALGTRLRWLILTDNQLDALPASIGECIQLQKLMLSGNRLKTLPRELSRCTRLELLRIAANHLDELPAWLMSMPRLSWLAYAGNPFCAPMEAAALATAPAPAIPWDQFNILNTLGQGASGVIFQAEQQCGEQTQPVAVKVFKGEVTSDGLPRSEMAACVRAGSHRGLIPVLGTVTNHPAGAHGLVMPLVDPRFLSLGHPPSFDSCTRDVYEPGARFTWATVARLAQTVASAMAHLHRRGIMHGDLYAHNILHDGHGGALLGDFGAASFYQPGGKSGPAALQALEVRAFGCLLEEWIERCTPPSEAMGDWAALDELKSRCLSPAPGSRPLFNEIENTVRAMAAP
ncbi:serine/threonine protein kinase [Acidovorax delafieldii 2AN]|uniref:Serine/threonine protein kinase n=1 Tax=Acidovorax delafieldii 2AN TaxID=573060 RepID=C5T5B3_ACIDE|nr:leucine-rich repeat-containing protein kinase family protein [Acidovorax delafieldii]EER60337.1 serine/threonine protein kinase [Acidovorax delafieldii 2AN]